MCFPLDYSIMNGDLTRKEFSLGCSCTMKVQEVQETNMAVIERLQVKGGIGFQKLYQLQFTSSKAQIFKLKFFTNSLSSARCV